MGVIGHVTFYQFHFNLIESAGNAKEFPRIIWHALRLDVAIAGYAIFIPTLLLIVGTWVKGKFLSHIWNTYLVIAVAVIVLANTANIALYSYWGFPLDSTPLFYLLTSPADAAASVSVFQIVILTFIIILITAIGFGIISFFVDYDELCKPLTSYRLSNSITLTPTLHRIAATIALILMLALLIIPVRGGFTVAANNVGSVYFSENMRMNHAAVNPVFSFLESVNHEGDFASQYRFMDNNEAEQLFSKMVYTKQRTSTSVDADILSPSFLNAMKVGKEKQKDGVRVILVVLESFSKNIMDCGGRVKGITPTLDRLASNGIYFSNIYANSFRTDRGLMAILSGYPAQPTMSLMKYPRKTNELYSISRTLRNAGYATNYIYGGDANFTNMRSYLMATGFEQIVSEENYPQKLRTSKWGVHDEYLFERALTEIDMTKKKGNSFWVIQTSSSHEPFEVPSDAISNKVLNAFNYTDTQLGKFIDKLSKRDDWGNTLLVLVPDHMGCYPEHPNNFQLYRYQIPLIMTGGAIKGHKVIPTIGSQHDIAATLLTLLNETHEEFTFSKDLLDSNAPHFAFFTVPDAMGMVTDDNQLIFDNTSGKIMLDEGKKKSLNLKRAQAYLQKLYDDIDNL